MSDLGAAIAKEPVSSAQIGKGAEGFPFEDFLKAGDRICFGQACSEPTGLLAELLRQGERLHSRFGRLKLLVFGSYSGLIRPEHAQWFQFEGYGAIGDSAALAKKGLLEIHPVHYSQLEELLRGPLRPDVMLIQLGDPDEQGRHGLGVACDFQLTAARSARVVIAEVTRHAPGVPGAWLPEDIQPVDFIRTDAPLVEVPRAPTDETAAQIGAWVAGLIPDEATLQLGVGSVMDAICKALSQHRNLGLHGGILTDGMADLMRVGVANHTRKGTYPGQATVGSLLGSRQLFEFADRNPAIALMPTEFTHSPAVLAQQHRLCSVNSAVEVDLTGQVNAEVSRGRYIGAVGGQVDFVRAAARSEGGLSVIALPSTAQGGAVSRIVAQLQGPVTTPRSDIDCVVTEWGVARLHGLSLTERVRAMVAIAHPEHRPTLNDFGVY